MTADSFYTRQMLVRYSRQLVAARRLARYERLLGRDWQQAPEAAALRRRTMVERITREIVENLFFSGSESPIVQEVRDRLARETGEELVFRYPPGTADFRIFRTVRDGEEEELLPEERRAVMARLWDVTGRVVDATML